MGNEEFLKELNKNIKGVTAKCKNIKRRIDSRRKKKILAQISNIMLKKYDSYVDYILHNKRAKISHCVFNSNCGILFVPHRCNIHVLEEHYSNCNLKDKLISTHSAIRKDTIRVKLNDEKEQSFFYAEYRENRSLAEEGEMFQKMEKRCEWKNNSKRKNSSENRFSRDSRINREGRNICELRERSDWKFAKKELRYKGRAKLKSLRSSSKSSNEIERREQSEQKKRKKRGSYKLLDILKTDTMKSEIRNAFSKINEELGFNDSYKFFIKGKKKRKSKTFDYPLKQIPECSKNKNDSTLSYSKKKIKKKKRSKNRNKICIDIDGDSISSGSKELLECKKKDGTQTDINLTELNPSELCTYPYGNRNEKYLLRNSMLGTKGKSQDIEKKKHIYKYNKYKDIYGNFCAEDMTSWSYRKKEDESDKEIYNGGKSQAMERVFVESGTEYETSSIAKKENGYLDTYIETIQVPKIFSIIDKRKEKKKEKKNEKTKEKTKENQNIMSKMLNSLKYFFAFNDYYTRTKKGKHEEDEKEEIQIFKYECLIESENKKIYLCVCPICAKHFYILLKRGADRKWKSKMCNSQRILTNINLLGLRSEGREPIRQMEEMGQMGQKGGMKKEKGTEQGKEQGEKEGEVDITHEVDISNVDDITNEDDVTNEVDKKTVREIETCTERSTEKDQDKNKSKVIIKDSFNDDSYSLSKFQLTEKKGQKNIKDHLYQTSLFEERKNCFDTCQCYIKKKQDNSYFENLDFLFFM